MDATIVVEEGGDSAGPWLRQANGQAGRQARESRGVEVAGVGSLGEVFMDTGYGEGGGVGKECVAGERADGQGGQCG